MHFRNGILRSKKKQKKFRTYTHQITNNSSATFEYNDVFTNSTGTEGGAIKNNSGARVEITNGNFTNNGKDKITEKISAQKILIQLPHRSLRTTQKLMSL